MKFIIRSVNVVVNHPSLSVELRVHPLEKVGNNLSVGDLFKAKIIDTDTFKDQITLTENKKEIVKDDVINHPKHYTSKSGVECIQVTEQFDFVLGNVIKYVWRAGEKESNSKLQDLKKAKWYLDRAIENEIKIK
jgi:hypothetical protein